MKNISYDSAFVPEGAPSSETYNAFTFGAGVQWFEAYDAAEKEGRHIVGGLGVTVGTTGGWIQGGGHSSLSPTYGLGVDNAVQMTVVVSTGEHLTVNAHQHTDLFWALRGGGGGTYGILTSVTYRTYPVVPVVATSFSANSTNTSLLQSLFTSGFGMLPSLGDAGWGGYGILSNTTLSFFYMSPNVSWAQANETWKPFFSQAENLTQAGLSIMGATTMNFSSFYTLWDEAGLSPVQQGGGAMVLGNRLVPQQAIESNNTELTKALLEVIPDVSWNSVAGGKVAEADPDSVGLNPAWRKALVSINWGATWDDGTDAQEITSLLNTVKEQEASIRALMPDSGCYFNEASPFEADFQYTFFGDHYAKLKSIKDQYDPHGLFVVRQGVGSDEWNDDLTCRVE